MPSNRKRVKLTLQQRLDARTDKTSGQGPNGDCWESNYTPSQKYPVIGINRVPHGAHRVAYMLAKGPIPIGLMICHSCDNPRCVRPSHLWAGTGQQNMADAAQKRRMAHGEGHGSTSLTRVQVAEIRRQRLVGRPQRHVARQFGVSQSTVWRIAHRKTWNHLN